MNDDGSWNSDEEFLGEMLTSGAAKGIVRDEDDGELMISWDIPMLIMLYPQVYEAMMQIHMEEVQETLNEMVSDGLLEVDPVIHPDGEIDETYSLTDLGKKVLDGLDTQD